MCVARGATATDDRASLPSQSSHYEGTACTPRRLRRSTAKLGPPSRNAVPWIRLRVRRAMAAIGGHFDGSGVTIGGHWQPPLILARHQVLYADVSGLVD